MSPYKRPGVSGDDHPIRPAKHRIIEHSLPSAPGSSTDSHPSDASGQIQLPYPSTSSQIGTKPVPFQQPFSLLTFSYSPSRTLLFSDEARKYYVPPPQGANLRYEYERWVKRPEEKGRVDGLLRGILKIRERMDRSANAGDDRGGSETGIGTKWLSDIGVVSWRGVMTKYVYSVFHLPVYFSHDRKNTSYIYERILIAPYEERDGWEMNVMRVGDTLYFEEHISDAKLVEKYVM